MWISFNNDSPLTRFDRATNSFQKYRAADGLPNGMPNSFCEDVKGNIWIGLPDGLARYRAGRFSHWSTIDGAPKGIIREIFSDHAGRVWIASSLGGVARIDDPTADTPTFKIYSVAEGLSGNATCCLAEDKFGRIYVRVGRGVDRVDPATGRIKHYTTEDGLANSFVSSGFRDRDGNIWFGMLNGLSRLIPEPDLVMDPVPVWISGLHWLTNNSPGRWKHCGPSLRRSAGR